MDLVNIGLDDIFLYGGNNSLYNSKSSLRIYKAQHFILQAEDGLYSIAISFKSSPGLSEFQTACAWKRMPNEISLFERFDTGDIYIYHAGIHPLSRFAEKYYYCMLKTFEPRTFSLFLSFLTHVHDNAHGSTIECAGK